MLKMILIINKIKYRATYDIKTVREYRILFRLVNTPLMLYHFPNTANRA